MQSGFTATGRSRQRTAALTGFKGGKYRVLVATDIAARGIDVEALGHVVNFDVPKAPEDYVHRVGRTARAEATGDAFTFVAPDEEDELRRIEKVVGKRLPRVTVPDFDYQARPAGKLEIPIGVRLAEARGQRRHSTPGSPARSGGHAQGRPPSPQPARTPHAARLQQPRRPHESVARPQSPRPERPRPHEPARSPQAPPQPGGRGPGRSRTRRG